MGTSASNVSYLLDAQNIGLEYICKIASILGVKAQDIVTSPSLSERNPFKDYLEQIEIKKTKPSSFTLKCPHCNMSIKMLVQND